MAKEPAKPVLVSSCLLGQCCRYNALVRENKQIKDQVESAPELWIGVCPEVLGGLPTPRPAATIVGGEGKDVLSGQARVIDINGDDVTAAFLTGAHAGLAAAQRAGVEVAYLKSRSPSCGSGELATSGETPTRSGDGVFAALLKAQGIRVLSIDFDPPFEL